MTSPVLDETLEMRAKLKLKGLSSDLQAHVETAVILARNNFRSIKFIAMGIIEDPNSAEHYVAIEAHVPLSMNEATDSYRAFCVEWGKRVPWPQRGLISLIHSVTYDP